MRSMPELVLMNYMVLAWVGLSWFYIQIKRRREGTLRASLGRA
jgi:hypothetical protein